MNRYQLKFTLSNGNTAVVLVVAPDEKQAIARVKQTPEFIEFCDGAEIVDVVSSYSIPVEALNPDDFILQKSSEDGWWVVTHKPRKIVVKFKEGSFNNVQQHTILFDNPPLDAIALAAVLREIGEYLYEYHKNLL